MPLTRTLRPLAPRVQYPRRVGVRVDAALAAELGCTEARAHRLLYSFPRLTDLIPAAFRAHRLAGDEMGLARLTAAVQAAAAGDPAPLTPMLQLAAQEADTAEDLLETAYHLHPCRETAEPLVRAKGRQLLREIALHAALVARWGL